jgi:hypothetical protein
MTGCCRASHYIPSQDCGKEPVCKYQAPPKRPKMLGKYVEELGLRIWDASASTWQRDHMQVEMCTFEALQFHPSPLPVLGDLQTYA